MSYKSTIDAKKAELKATAASKLQKNAESQRENILKAIEATAPVFWKHYKESIEAGLSAWWNTDPDAVGGGYGVPGIVMWGHLFIGLEWDSDCWRLRIGSWSCQEGWTNEADPGKVERQAPIAIEDMDSRRLDIESRFAEGVEDAIALITAHGNKSSFASWTGPSQL